MTVASECDLRQRWQDSRPSHGIWSLLPGAVSAELLARSGADFVVLDLQHGALGEWELPGVTAAIAAAGATPFVRTRSPHFADIGRPLDLGAKGIFVPNVIDTEHVREVVRASRYGPGGTRSIGRLSGDAECPLTIVVLETASALSDLDEILNVDGLDGVYIGPKDLALSMGRAGEGDRDYMREVVSSIVARAVKSGVPVGVHTSNGAEAAAYLEEGATIVMAAVDTTALAEAVGDHLRVARRL
nr:aldolase/citrate lyase family protein [Rhodococcus wratislaviensis]GLK39905.1 4-hydroxy-2-oxo-heptane-1,7-dioate aldolase [Rhodococcus wratislaviensis]